ncbi:hypothetical protein QZH41_004893 [Actinostola sp. cb2023]|nr:hypothetical protein QZH41_004893 [Actinostola sp. cb2023]
MVSFIAVIPLMLLRVSYHFKFCGVIPLTEHQAYLFHVYRSFTITFMFPVPLLIIAASYLRLGAYIYQQRVPRVASVGGSIRMDAGRKENLDVIKTLAVIVILFVVFMLPLFVARVQYEIMYRSEVKSMSAEFLTFVAYTRLLALSHSCVNPIIYELYCVYFTFTGSRWHDKDR